MEFCNKGMVQADPAPPQVMVKDHIFTFFLGPFPYWTSVSLHMKYLVTQCEYFT